MSPVSRLFVTLGRAGVLGASAVLLLAGQALGAGMVTWGGLINNPTTFNLLEDPPPPAPPIPQVCDITLTDTVWVGAAFPFEIRMFDDPLGTPTMTQLSDRILYLNMPDAAGILTAHIVFLSDDLFDSLHDPRWPSMLPEPFPRINENDPLNNPFTFDIPGIGGPPFGGTYLRSTISSDLPNQFGTLSDFITLVVLPTPGTLALFAGAGLIGLRRRRA